MRSIAVPTIGTGKIGLNADDVAKKMFQVVLTFAQQGKTNLQKIHFIIFPTDSNSYTAFQQALSGVSMNWYTNQQIVQILTNPANSKEVDCKSDYQLLLKARCNTTKVPVDIKVFHGTINDVKADAIIDMTALCFLHNSTDNHVDFNKYNDTKHTLQTLRYLNLSNHNIYRVCPYGCLAGFGKLLARLNAGGEKSVVIPLLDIEMNRKSIDILVDLIQSFMKSHLKDSNSINCFNFTIGYQDRSTEIATWIQDKLSNKNLEFRWTVVKHVSVQNFGMNVYFVANDKTAIANTKKSISTSNNSWANYKMTDDDYFNSIESIERYHLALKIWSEYNTVICHDTSTNVSIFGYEADITNTVSYIHKLSKTYLEEKAHREVQEFAAEAAQWYIIIGSFREKFESRLNYEIEKNYNNYCKDKSKMIFYIDSNTKVVDYGSMKIKDLAKGVESSISKSAYQGSV